MLYLNKFINIYLLVVLIVINFFLFKSTYISYLIIFILLFSLIISKKVDEIVKSIFISILILYLNNINIIRIIFIIIAFKLLLNIIFYGIKINKSLVIYFIFIFFIILGVVFSLDKKLAFEGLIMYFRVFILSMYIIQCKDDINSFSETVNFIAFFNFIFIFIFYMCNYKILGDVERWDIYFNGTNGLRSNGIGTFIISMIPFNVYLVISNKDKMVKIVNFVLSFISIFTIFILSSRSAIITLIIVLIILYLKIDFKYKRKITLYFIGILIIFIIINNILNLRIIENNLNRFLISNSIDDFSSGRINLYKDSILAFKNSPLIGIGVYNMGYFIYKYSIFLDCHNFILTYLSTTGLIGLILFISWIYVTAINPLIKTKIRNGLDIINPFLFATIINIIQSLFEPVITVFIPFIMFSLYLNISYKLYRLEVRR